MMESGASKEVIKDQNSDEGDSGATGTIASHPDFGTWTVQEIQLCRMHGKNSHRPWFSEGSIWLVD